MKRQYQKTGREREFLQCLSCQRWTPNKCNDCQTAAYCNDRCRQMQKELHKKVCFPLLGDRLRAMVSYSKANGVKLDCLSSSAKIRDRSVSAFSWHVGDHCAVCETSESVCTSKSYYIYLDNQSMYYYLCRTCIREGRRLCQVSLMEPTLCREVYMNRTAFFIFLNKTLLWKDFPVEVVSYILSWFFRITRVSICIH